MKQKFARKKINTLDYLYKTETWDNFFNVCLTSLKEKSLEELINLKENYGQHLSI